MLGEHFAPNQSCVGGQFDSNWAHLEHAIAAGAALVVPRNCGAFERLRNGVVGPGAERGVQPRLVVETSRLAEVDGH
eukprot:6997129-Prymnesium_polylepis.3